jgi:uncharacterized repeat protein (TIGR01451 family)
MGISNTYQSNFMFITQFFERLKKLQSCFLLVALTAFQGYAWATLGASVTLLPGQPTDIYPGQTTQLVITLSNDSTAADITNVAFNSSLPGVLPNGLKIAGSATYTCTNSAGSVSAQGILTATDGTQTLSLSGAVIPAAAFTAPPPPQVPVLINGFCTITLPLTAGTSDGSAATHTFTIPSGSISGIQNSAPVTNTGAVSQSVNVRALTRPEISKNFSSSTLVLGGGTATLTITVANSNPVPIANFSVTDVFPELGLNGGIIRVATPPNATSSCTATGSAAIFSPAPGDKTVTASAGTLPANGSCTLTVRVEADHTNGAFTTGARSNVINAATQFSNDVGIAAAANASANITVNSPLGVTKSVSPPAIQSGTTGSFTITFSNSSNTPLNIVSFTDSPIDGITGNAYGLLVDTTSTTCVGGVTTTTPNSQGVTLTGGTIPAGGSCSVTINFTGTVQTAYTTITYTNTINQGAVDVGNPTIVSEPRSAAVTVYDVLNINKTVTPANAAPGSAVRYSVTVENWSGSALNNLVITDVLSNGQTFLNGTINGINYSPTTNCTSVTTSNATGASTVVLTIDSVPALSVGPPLVPGSCTVNFWVMTSVSGGAYSNQLGPGSVCSGAICNGSSSGGASGNTVDTLVVAKTFSHAGTTQPPSPLARPEGTIVRMAFTLSNRSINPLTNVNIADTLPVSGTEQLRIANPSNAATTCGGVITADPGTSSVALNGGTVPARASSAGVPGTGAEGVCALYVDVVGAAGSYDNTAVVTANQTYANNTAAPLSVNSNNATLTYLSTLSASKSFSPALVSSGGRSTLRIRVGNSGAVALTNVAVTDPLPSGMVVANPSNAYTTCAGSTSITAVSGSNSAGLTGALIAGNGNCDFIFDVIATGNTNWVNTIPAGNITADGGVRNQTPVSATLAYQIPVGLSVAKSTFPGTLTFPGQASELTITLTNGGTAVSNLSLTDYFTLDGTANTAPNGMVIAAITRGLTTCPGGGVLAQPGGRSVTVSGVTLAPNASCTVKVNVTSTATGGITNIIPPGSIANDQGLSNSGQASTSLATQSNIGVTKQFTPNLVKPGERSRLRITFFNPTAQPAAQVSVTDTLPTGVTVPAGANPTTTCAGAALAVPSANQVQISGANLAAANGAIAASCQAEIDVMVSSAGEYINTIPAGAVTANVGGATVSNATPATDTLRAMSPLMVNKAFSDLTLDAGNPAGFTTGVDNKAPGASATMTIRLNNPNASTLTAIAFTDLLPSGLVLSASPNAISTCPGATLQAAPSGTTVSLTGATLAPAAFCTVTASVLSNISGVYTNVIPTGSVTSFEGVRNEEPSSARIVISTPPTVSKQFSPAVIPPGGISRLSIVLGNSNSVAMTLEAALVDTLPIAPGNIVVAATPNVVSSCSGAITASPGTGTVTLASGGTIPPGGCMISVDVTGTSAGVHTNNIPAGALQTNFGNNQTAANTTLRISTQGFISGRVFTDNNLIPNGSYDAGTDTPLAGVSIELRSGATCAGTLVETKATDMLGNYLFFNLSAGTFSVCQLAQPAGTHNGVTTAGTITSVNGSSGSAGLASNPSPTTSQIIGIVLNNNLAGDSISGSPNNNFAEIVLSSISGTVFLDFNNNGVQNGADTGIAAVDLVLGGYSYGINGLDNGGTGDDVAVALNTTTDGNGNYSFGSLYPGRYSITQPTQPPATSNGITTPGQVPNGGTVATATGVLVLPSRLTGLILPPNTASTGNNFAEIPNGRTLSGQVFLDFNNNGLVDGRDYGLAGQSIQLTGVDVNGNAVSRSLNTNNDGSYSFTLLPEGTFTIIQPNQPTGTTNGQTLVGSTGGTATTVNIVPSTISGINLTGVNTVSGDNNFAELPGLVPDLTLSKSHTPAAFGEGSSTGFFTLSPRNIGLAATNGTVTIVDTLPSGMTLAAPATGNGWVCTGVIGASTISCTSNEVIAANGGVGNPISLRVAVATGTAGSILTNQAQVSCACEPSGFQGNNMAIDLVAISTSARVSGVVWRDLNHNRVRDSGETLIPNWGVELLLGGMVVATTSTDANGAYAFASVAPGAGYQIRFREAISRAIYGYAVTNEQGIVPNNNARDTGSTTPNTGTNNGNPGGADLSSQDGTLASLKLLAGDNIIEQSLPLDPSGVVYDSVKRQPVAGAVVEFGRVIAGTFTALPGYCLVGGTSSITTSADGYYEFLLLPGPPAGCPGSGSYTLRVTSPSGYLPAPSLLIPPCGQPGSSGSASLSVGSGLTLVQLSGSAPASGIPNHPGLAGACPASTPLTAVAQGSTQYYYNFSLTLGVSGNVVNNHIPIDPVLSGAIVMSKSTPLVNVTRGQLVPYTFTATNTLSATLTNINIRDQIPPGFRYRLGSATLNGVPAEPTVTGRDLIWPNLSFISGERKTWKMLLTVGSGVGEGLYTNSVWSVNNIINATISNIATATVRIVPDPAFDCSDIIGKVFDDKNANGYQDEGEPGLANVRLATARGLLVTTDPDGRFHVTCADVPQADRGANFVMKLDERTLPTGYRLTTENPRDVRVTRGKMVKLNFGATVHRVVHLELDARAFSPDTLDLISSGSAQLKTLPEKLQQRPSILRIIYRLTQDENNELARKRLDQLELRVSSLWEQAIRPGQKRQTLIIETELVGGAR